MTTTVGTPPAPHTPAVLARGFLTGGVAGAALTAFISGCIAGRISLVVIGLILLPAYGLLYFLFTLPHQVHKAAVEPQTALAMIESLSAVGGADDDGDVAVRFELTVAPDDARAYRVEIRQFINLVDVPGYQPRGIVVVQYPPERPGKARIVKKPTPAWAERAAAASLDSVPGPALKDESPTSCAGCLLPFLGLLLGAGAILGLFHHEVFTSSTSAAADTPSATSTDSSSTTTSTVTSDVGTVTLGPGQSMLDPGELRTAVDSVTKDADPRQALTVVLQDSRLTVVFAAGDAKTAGFDLSSLPYDRIPALVQEAKGVPGLGTPQSWQVTADGATGSLTLRVVATGDKGTETLVADGKGNVLQRSGP